MPIQENKENEINEIKNNFKQKNCIVNIKNCINFRKSPMDGLIFGDGIDAGMYDLGF